jgi:hypothetical protein
LFLQEEADQSYPLSFHQLLPIFLLTAPHQYFRNHYLKHTLILFKVMMRQNYCFNHNFYEDYLEYLVFLFSKHLHD